MGKSEWTDIHYLPSEKAQPQIKIDAEALLDLLLRAELMMTKVDRIRYATPAIVMIQDVIKELVLAYDFDDDRGVIRDMVELVSPKWLKYCHYNDDRRCFEANDGYRHHDILANTYKFKYHDSKRTKRAA